jgi:hypothetical protein
MAQKQEQPNSLLSDFTASIRYIGTRHPEADQNFLQVLVDAASIAQGRGTFNIKEAFNISAAVKHFTTPILDIESETQTKVNIPQEELQELSQNVS